MGQKVNPIGLRVGVVRDWDAAWYADKTQVSGPHGSWNVIRTMPVFTP